MLHWKTFSSQLFWNYIWRIPLDATKKLKGWEKPSLQNKLIMYEHCIACILLYLACMYFRVNLKMEKATFCCCFTWILFIQLNFTVAFLLIRKTWDNVGGGMGDFKKWGGILLMGSWYHVTDYKIIAFGN